MYSYMNINRIADEFKYALTEKHLEVLEYYSQFL